MTPDLILPTATVITRHSGDCKNAGDGESYRRCNCRKSVRVYNPGPATITIPTSKGRERALGIGGRDKFKANTRSWEQAEKVAQAWVNQFDPDKRALAEKNQELDALKAGAVSSSGWTRSHHVLSTSPISPTIMSKAFVIPGISNPTSPITEPLAI